MATRQRNKMFFLTWPQCPVPLEEVKAHLESIGPMVDYVIAMEEHADGEPHIHAMVHFVDRIEWGEAKFDFVFNDTLFHGNYQICRNKKDVVRYCTKDGEYLTNMDIESFLAKKGKVTFTKEELISTSLMELIQHGKVTAFNAPNFLRTRLHLQDEIIRESAASAAEEPDLPKKRHEWIHGPSNTGKTTTLRASQRDWSADGGFFEIPRNNDWKGYQGERHLFIDEFKGEVSVQDLNRLCDGDTKVNTKGGTTFVPRNRIVHVFSNFSIRTCYHKCDETLWNALENRFNETELTIIYE